MSAAYLPRHHPWTVPLVNQTQQFLAYGQPVLAPLIDPAQTLVAVWIGINDVRDAQSSAVADDDLPRFYDALLATLFAEAVQPVYAAGGYRHWLFLTLPPLDRVPGGGGAAAARPNATMVGWWDAALARHAAAFAGGGAEDEGVTALVFDANAFLNRVLDAPAAYGLRDTTSYCPWYDQPLPVTQYGCLPLEEYFWYDAGHM